MKLARTKLFAAATLLAGVLLSPSPAAAFECTRTEKNDFVSIRWHDSPIPYAIRAGSLESVPPEAAESAVARAFETWQTLKCSHVRFEARPIVPETTPLDEISQVIFVNAGWRHAPEAVGLTTMTYSTIDGTISFGKIEINDDGFDFSDAELAPECAAGPDDPPIENGPYDLLSVLTHEVGHFVGLAHVKPSSGLPLEGENAPTMAPTVPPCGISLRDLEPDDVEGLCFIYPAGQRARGCASLPDQDDAYVTSAPFSCASQRVATSGSAWSAAIITLLAALVACSRARSGR